MTASIGVQLWSVRDLIGKDFEGTLRQISEMGYEGVELAGFYDKTPKEATKILKKLGLVPLGVHHPLSTEKENRKAFKTAKAFGIKRFVVPLIDPADFKDAGKIQNFCATLNEGAKVAKEYGLTVGFHNHSGEFNKVKGKTGFATLEESLKSNVFFEVDTYWVKVGGVDPAQLLTRLGKRAPLLHVKDGPAKKKSSETPNVALGQGAMDFPAIFKAAKGKVEWAIVEFDSCATDILEGLRQSHGYLVRNKWVKGKGGKA